MDESLLATHVLRVFSHDGPFDEGMAALGKQNLDLITAETFADLRMRSPSDAKLNTEGAWVNAAYIYLRGPDHANILVVSGNVNPLVQPGEPALAAHAHRKGQAYRPSDAMVMALLTNAQTNPHDARKTGVLLIQRPNDRQYTHPTLPLKTADDIAAFGDSVVPFFLFGGLTKEYGQFLFSRGVRSVVHPVIPANSVSEPRETCLLYLADAQTQQGPKSVIYGDGCSPGVLALAGNVYGVSHESVARPVYAVMHPPQFTTASVPTAAR